MDRWLLQAASHSALTGKSQEAVPHPATQTDTGVQNVGRPTMGLKDALEQRRLKPLSPYNRLAWTKELACHDLQRKYPLLVQGLANGFDLRIPQVWRTCTPPNHPSIRMLPDVYGSIMEHEFAAGRYIDPFTCHKLKAILGPFQTSLLSLAPKTSKPGKFWAVHNFSHPHDPLPNASLINSHIDGNLFPCTWGTFTTVALLFSHLPSGL
jgi:hypothetical protein